MKKDITKILNLPGRKYTEEEKELIMEFIETRSLQLCEILLCDLIDHSLNKEPPSKLTAWDKDLKMWYNPEN